MDSHKTHKAFVQMAKQLEQTSGHNDCSVVRLVCVWFPIATYVKDILLRCTKTNSKRVIEFVALIYNNLLTIREWQSL